MSRSFNNQGSVQTLGGSEILDGIQPPPLTASVNDYSSGVAGFDSASLLLLSATTPANMTGLKATLAKRAVTLVNLSPSALTLKDSDAGSAAANRFRFGGSDATLTQFQAISLLYLLGVGWIAAGGGGGGGGGAPTTGTYLTATDETLTLPNSVLTVPTGARLTLSANQALPGASTLVAFDVSQFDTGTPAKFFSAGSPGLLKAPKAGLYLASASGVFDSGTEAHMNFLINGAGAGFGFESGACSHNLGLALSVLLNLALNDTVQVNIDYPSGSGNIIGANQQSTFSLFAIH